MHALSAAVVEAGLNRVHGAALVLVMLVFARRPMALDPARPPYPKGPRSIDGKFFDDSESALRQPSTTRGSSMPAVVARRWWPAPRRAPSSLATSPGAGWWPAMPAGFSDLRVLPGSKTVYAAGTAEQLKAATVSAQVREFLPHFKARLTLLTERIHQHKGFVVSVCDQGDLRSFQAQYDRLTGPGNVTNAGPGEGNHSFGQAVDPRFKSLRRLHDDGVVEVNET